MWILGSDFLGLSQELLFGDNLLNLSFLGRLGFYGLGNILGIVGVGSENLIRGFGLGRFENQAESIGEMIVSSINMIY